MSAATKADTQLIKKSIAFRAKYRVEQGSEPTMRLFAPPLAVPHPKNRGGDPVKSLRTIQLSGSIVQDGCDVVEANSNAVAVEDNPSKPRFQSFFEEQVKSDPHMLKKSFNIVASIGTLSHGHLNCMMRNVLGGHKGCECVSTVVEGTDIEKQECKCANKPILTANGCYSMELVRKYDGDWGSLCERGIVWEMLSHRMDEEEPEAALLISIALNKKNESAMKTSHTEIMNTLVGLCKPSPADIEGKVPFDPVRDKMIELYGANVDHPDFFHAFRVVMDAGGHDSPHMANLQDFTNVYVNPKLRKMRYEAYAVISDYPLEFPRLKNACLKWAWKQTPKRGWCELPVSVSHRLSDRGAFSMLSLMREIEEAFLWLGKVVSKVVDAKDAQRKTKWSSEVEISIVAKVFATPKKDEDGKSVAEQEGKLREECKDVIAAKLVQLMRVDETMSRSMPVVCPADNAMLVKVQESYLNNGFVRRICHPIDSSVRGGGGDVALVPKVIKMDSSGRPISAHDTMLQGKKDHAVEIIDWQSWRNTQRQRQRSAQVKAMAASSILILNEEMRPHRVAVIRKAGKVYTKSAIHLEIGDLSVPLNVNGVNSLAAVAADGGVRHPHSVGVHVSWPVSEFEKANGIEEEAHLYDLTCQPELNLPKPVRAGQTPAWSLSSSAHVFWCIRRQEKADDLWNCEIKHREVVTVLAAAPGNQTSIWKSNGVTETVQVRVPYIVNTKQVEADTELILKWQVLVKEKSKQLEKTWVSDVKRAEAKRAKFTR